MRRKKLAVLSLLIGLALPLQADELAIPPDAEDQPQAGELTESSLPPIEEKSFIDDFQANFSSRLEAMVKQVDRFFATESGFEEATESYLLLSTELDIEDGDPELFGNIKAKIQLPATERRLRLLIESDPEEETPREISDIPSGDERKDSYYLSLEHQFRKTGQWDIRPSLGIKTGTPLNPFARLRAIRYFQMQDWLLRFSSGLFWFQNGGTGANINVNLDHAFSDDTLFRSASTILWNYDDRLNEVGQTFSLYQRFQKRRRIVYQVGLHGNDEPNWRLNDYFVRLVYRSNLYRKWLFFDIQPELVYRSEDDFDLTPRLLLRVEAFFGREYL